jgi:hypothetical protein
MQDAPGIEPHLGFIAVDACWNAAQRPESQDGGKQGNRPTKQEIGVETREPVEGL